MDIIQKITTNILNPILQLLFAFGVGYFLYGVMKFVLNQDNEDAQEAGKQHMLWGIIGLAIMVSAWGILHFIDSTLLGII
ncbi:MAG: hypothetical protein HZB10_01835 [Candidatus Yonathbacteria bacterium]|nr:hypothetical protein [Candidatus Yonathbacteria bacterium]